VTQLVLPLQTRPALGREDFIVAPANRDAVAFIDAYPEWPAPVTALYGPEGSGKSHLAAAWAGRVHARIVEADTLDETIVHDDDCALVVENVDSCAPRSARDSALFALIERGTAMLLTGREPPSQWRAAIPDLASRYRAMMAFALWAPDDVLLGAMARKLFADKQLAVPDSVIEYLIHSIERSPSAIRDAVGRADARALAEKRPVTVALLREILAERRGNLL
jgi:chromosomal replication initiation ATPase DnaA